MKKHFGLILSMLIFTGGLHANYNGNIAEPDLIDHGLFFGLGRCFGLKVGYVRDDVVEKKFHIKHGLLKSQVDKFEMHSNLAVLSFSYIHRFEIYGAAGSAKISYKDRPGFTLIPPNLQLVQHRAKDHVQYGLGFRAILYKCHNTIFGSNVSYYMTHPDLDWESLAPGVPPTLARLNYREWQISVGAAQKFKWFSPYLAVEFSGAQGNLRHPQLNVPLQTPNYTMKLKNNVGLVAGTSFVNGDYFDANVELRTISQLAFSFALNAKF